MKKAYGMALCVLLCSPAGFAAQKKAAKKPKAVIQLAELTATAQMQEVTPQEEAPDAGAAEETVAESAQSESSDAAQTPAVQAAVAAKAAEISPKGCVLGLQKVTNFYEIKTGEIQRLQKRIQAKMALFFQEVDDLKAELASASKELEQKENRGGKKDKAAIKEIKKRMKAWDKALVKARKEIRNQCAAMSMELKDIGDRHLDEFSRIFKEVVKEIKVNSNY